MGKPSTATESVLFHSELAVSLRFALVSEYLKDHSTFSESARRFRAEFELNGVQDASDDLNELFCLLSMSEAAAVTRHSAVIGASSSSRDFDWPTLAFGETDLADLMECGARRHTVLSYLKDKILAKIDECHKSLFPLDPRGRLAFLNVVFISRSLTLGRGRTLEAETISPLNPVELLEDDIFPLNTLRLLTLLRQSEKFTLSVLYLVSAVLGGIEEAVGCTAVKSAYRTLTASQRRSLLRGIQLAGFSDVRAASMAKKLASTVEDRQAEEKVAMSKQLVESTLTDLADFADNLSHSPFILAQL
ncbi:non-ribosomal peptide synthetase [Pseudohyphozyma bogoriensis]|nr:non-ribosomal peptide synthetase [Pseudohyphozyma bogoriensis]